MRTRPYPILGVALLCVAVSLGCGASHSADTEVGPLVIRVDPEDRMSDVARAARAATGAEGECMLVWGDVVTQPAEARPVRLVWAELEHIDGWLLCGEDTHLVLLDPRARHLAMLYYRGDELYVGPPTEAGVARMRNTPLSIRSDGPAPCLSVFDPDGSDDERAFRVLRHLREVPRDFLIAAWPMRPGSPTELELAAKE